MAATIVRGSSSFLTSRSVFYTPVVRPPRSRARTASLRVRGYTTTCHRTAERGREAILCQRLKGHEAAVTAALVLTDTDDKVELITSSLDKSIVLWRLEDDVDEDGQRGMCTKGADEVVRLTPPGAPIFSLVRDGHALGEDHNQIFCGNHSKSIVAWEPPDAHLQDKVVLNGHTGWVRSLATHGRYLFSAGCNCLRQWDMARAVPRHVRDIKLFTGDILGLTTGSNRVFSCGADGSIRAWAVTKKGELEAAPSREKAHKERVTAIVFHKGFLYSVSYDGSIKMWDAATMELVMEAPRAHDGARIHCAAAGADGFLYTGGDDKLVRRWQLGSLTPAANGADSLFCHNYAVRTLASGAGHTLVSGDASGEIAIWKV